MIRKNIEPGTKIFNVEVGFGIFKGWTEDGEAIVWFEDDRTIMARRHLTEVED